MNLNSQSPRDHKIHLENEQKTLLITLHAKALDSRRKNSILNDVKAQEMMERIDYRFEKLTGFGDGSLIVVRAKQIDAWLTEFLDSHPTAIVINLGCGLDTRVSRIDPQSGVRWFDIDYPEVIAVRQFFYADTDTYKMLASSITDSGWLDGIPCDEPTMIVAEGVLEYLTADDVEVLLNRITSYFPHGQIVFDVMNSFAINSGKEQLKQSTGAAHKWAVDSTLDVDKMNEHLTRVADISVFQSRYIRKLPSKSRVTYFAMSRFPSFRNMIRLLSYRF